MPKKRSSPDSVLCIDLTEDHDGEQEQRLGDIPMNLNSRSGLVKRDRSKRNKRATPVLMDDGYEIVEFPAPADLPFSRPSVVHTPSDGDDDDDDDDIEIVEPTIQPLVPAAAAVNAGNHDDEIEVVGAKNQINLPHMRQHCTQFPFDAATFNFQQKYKNATLDTNSKSCDLCYCYVCDCPVKDCQTWCSEGSIYRAVNHCCASDRVQFWTSRRSIAKATGSASNAVSFVAGTNTTTAQRPPTFTPCHLSSNVLARNSNEYAGALSLCGAPRSMFNLLYRGPFPTNDPNAGRNADCTKCRKCGYFSQLESSHSHFRDEHEYCHKCGRVASNVFFGKRQTKDEKNQPGTLLFSRDVTFRLQTHDPRSMLSYKESWKEFESSDDPAWQYSEAEMEEDVFRHRIGSRPQDSCIKDLLRTERSIKSLSTRQDYLVLSKENEAFLILGVPDSMHVVVKASWDKRKRLGTFTIHLYSTFKAGSYPNPSLVVYLGVWFEIFPKRFDIGKRLKADYSSERSKCKIRQVRDSEAFTTQLFEAAQKHNAMYEEDQGGLKLLLCSSGNPRQGHFCQNDTTFTGVLERYVEEYLTRWLSATESPGPWSNWIDRLEDKIGEIHRDDVLGMLLGSKEAEMSRFLFRDDAHTMTYNDYSIEAAISRLENVGHEAIDLVEGLNVDLLEFQRQTLKWALERETMDGGIQRLFWAKLPCDESQDQDQNIYFNPNLSAFRLGAPNLVRGGFISDEMGLGKTVVTLALILKNPAPELPKSGSPVDALANTSLTSPWDKTLYKKTSTCNKKRGRIISRGTLVICPVSLVGQWIEEAKSKLVNPGLVYSYHGQSRNRDANILATNSIVVTTYQVLASDATYHSKKAGVYYCPPLEQVRWWRIVCDEGHSLKGSQTQRAKAALSLVADHKWLVSGTPLNTSIKDLSNQFKFLGIENADEIIRRVGGPQSRRAHCNNEGRLEELQFLLGGIMMRHSQNQKYRGTQTTLMSLPKKTERTITISFSSSEKAEYEKLEKEAHNFYVTFRSNHLHEITKHFLKLSQKLTTLRVACSGGKYPLPGSGKVEDHDDHSADQSGPAENNSAKKKLREKKSVQFSDFVFKSKFHALLIELNLIRDDDPTAKCLVFSQFASTLKWLEEELPKRGFQFRTLSGSMSMRQRAKALHDFQLDPPTTIFLLSMRAGAVGINLTQANRVFLMEPSFNPALERQAVGRVHRLGQKREVQITRLIQSTSVESRLLDFLKKKHDNAVAGSDNATSNSSKKGTDESDKTDRESGVGLVGNVSRDKADMMIADFDLLFGATPLKSDDADSSNDSGEVMADLVMSGVNH